MRTADLRYFGQAFEVRVAGAGRADRRGACSTRSPAGSTPSTRALYGYDFAGDATQQVEWVNLRVSGIGPIQRPEITKRRSTMVSRHAPRAASTSAARPVCFDAADGYVDTPVLLAARPRRRARSSTGPAIIEEFGSTVPLHPGFTARSTTTSTSS